MRLAKELFNFLRKNVSTLELVGVDRNDCIAGTALDSIKKDLQLFIKNLVSKQLTKKFAKVRMKLIKKV